MRTAEPAALTWRKSSYSESHSDNCVEVARIDTGAAVRDTKNREAGHLTLPAPAWRAFLAGLLV